MTEINTEAAEAPETNETPEPDTVDVQTVETPEADAQDVSEGTEDEQDTFPREYVEKLRKESAGYRDKAKKVDEYAAALWALQVEHTGRLADHTDLPAPEGVDPLDRDAVTAAVEDLLARKPHLAARRPAGDIGQGHTPQENNDTLGSLIRARI